MQKCLTVSLLDDKQWINFVRCAVYVGTLATLMWAILDYNIATFLKENLNSLRHVMLTQGIKLPRNLSAMLSFSRPFSLSGSNYYAVELLLLLFVGNLRYFLNYWSCPHCTMESTTLIQFLITIFIGLKYPVPVCVSQCPSTYGQFLEFLHLYLWL